MEVVKGCSSHSYCTDCITKYVASKSYFYCPFSMMNMLLLVDDNDNGEEAQSTVRKSECPNCSRRLFCAHAHDHECNSSNSNDIINNDPTFVCEICVEPKSASNESFAIGGCTHSYCTDCVAKYVASKLQENVPTIGCPVPGCGGYLDPEYCRRILPPEVFDRWGNALCEAAIVGSHKFYCPFKDCSAMMIDDGEEVLMECECPNCKRLFCAQCKVPWHTGIVCSEFQNLNENEREREDIMLMNLAQNKRWRRCPYCKIFVERTEGCLYMHCRCGTAFCYNCRNIYKQTDFHYCKKCRR